MNPDASTARTWGFDSKVDILLRGESAFTTGSLKSITAPGVKASGADGGVEAMGLDARRDAGVEGDGEPWK